MRKKDLTELIMAYEAFDRLNQLVMELTDGYPIEKRTFVINIRVPAGAEEGLYYPDGGIYCLGSKLRLKPDENYPDMQYMIYDADAFFLNGGMVMGDKYTIEPVEKDGKFIFDVTKNKHYKIGVYTSNDSDEDIVISFTVYNVDMWID